MTTEQIDIDALERKLEEACACVTAKGWRITAGLTRDNAAKLCCPFGAVLVCQRKRAANTDRAAELLGLRPLDADRFVEGFDGGGLYVGPLVDLGRKFRERYVEVPS